MLSLKSEDRRQSGSPSPDALREGLASPVFGRKLGYGGQLSELALAHKGLLPVQTNQERTTLRRTSSSLSDSAARLTPMLHEDSVYNVTSEPVLVAGGVVSNARHMQFQTHTLLSAETSDTLLLAFRSSTTVDQCTRRDEAAQGHPSLLP